jgi:hypothetical protein
MRYLFSALIVLIAWVTTIAISTSSNLHTGDRLILYICLMVLTGGLYRIGFTKK